MDAYQFDETFKAIRGFAWDVLADNYIELAKSRLYGDGEGKQAAQYTLYVAIETLSRLLAPFLPYFSEEIYSHIKKESIHLQLWPEVNESLIDEHAEARGELIKEMTSAIRRYKGEHGMPLNAPLKEIEIYSTISDASDVAGAANSTIKLKSGTPDFELVPKDIKPNMKVLGKTYRSKAKSIAEALIRADLNLAGSGSITLDVDGEDMTIDATCFTVEKERLLKGKSVDVLEVGSATIVIMR